MHSYSSCLFHCVFSTKRREPWLTSEIRDRLWPYLGGIARENEMKALAIGGVADHVHVLLSHPSAEALGYSRVRCRPYVTALIVIGLVPAHRDALRAQVFPS